MTTLAACTIVSKNYLPYARVLAESFLESQPEGRFFVLLVDRVDGHFDPENEPFTLVEVEELENIPDLPSFLFKYTILEANTAVKPFFLAHLFERFELANLVYFDPDILITGSLEELAGLVERHSIVVTPHLTDPIDDEAHPSEQAILQAGAYNLGFIALRRSEVTERLLTWWQDRLYDRCLVKIDEGLFVDQKWIDLVPGIFGDVHILRDPGYNVAYWNLHGRRVTLDAEAPNREARSNDRPLVFFHFSGIDPGNLRHVSKHQDRFTLADLGGAAELYRRYSDKVLAAGFRDTKPWPYAFAVFTNGVRIPEAARRIYLELGRRRQRFGDPFATEKEDSFFDWLQAPRRPGKPESLPRLLGRLYDGRSDLRRIFPDVEGSDRLDFYAWLLDFGRHELRLDEAFLSDVPRDSQKTLWTVQGMKRRVRNRLKRLYHSELGQGLRRHGKRALGHERYGELRERLRPDESAAEAKAPSPTGGYRLPPPESIESFGVNLVGYLQAETGMGQAARSLAFAFEAAGIPVSLHSLDLNVLARRGDTTFEPATSDFPYDINLFVLNADQVAPVYEHLGADVFAGRWNVGFWLWELETFPDRWRGAFDVLHEIWTPSSFCADAIAGIAPVPVRRVPLPVEVDEEVRPASVAGEIDRARFDLPEDAFVFLFTFNFLSYVERKNPHALVRAFRRAFPDGGAVLVLKTSQSDFAPGARKALEAEIGDADVRILDEYFSRQDVERLVATVDAYVSLHRSEGFGLTLAEAMLLEKPVIATAYSGNVDFFNLNNGYPVRYHLVEIAEDSGPYPRGAVWAEPEVEHAAELMRRVVEKPDEARGLGARARQDIARELSYAAVGEELRRRMEEIAASVGPRNTNPLPPPG